MVSLTVFYPQSLRVIKLWDGTLAQYGAASCAEGWDVWGLGALYKKISMSEAKEARPTGQTAITPDYFIQSLDSVEFLESYRTLNPLGGSGTADSVLPCDRFTGC